MKKSIPIHAVWAIIAVIAFAVGAKNFSNEASSKSSDSETQSGARYTDRSQANGYLAVIYHSSY